MGVAAVLPRALAAVSARWPLALSRRVAVSRRVAHHLAIALGSRRSPHAPEHVSQSHRRRESAAGGLAAMSDITYLTQEQAQALDADLMGPELQFSIDQLMELAGLSVASALHSEYDSKQYPRVLILVGPGNNGGDGLVAARHLYQFGYSVEVCYPKRTDKPLFHGLVAQCEAHGIRFAQPEELQQPGGLAQRCDVVCDALFGFSFKGPPRAPLDKLLNAIKPVAKPPPIVSVDIPSGWDVEGGPGADGDNIEPDMLVSLTAPKLAAKHFSGVHYLGGRFVPPIIKEKYGLQVPEYPGVMQCVRIS